MKAISRLIQFALTFLSSKSLLSKTHFFFHFFILFCQILNLAVGFSSNMDEFKIQIVKKYFSRLLWNTLSTFFKSLKLHQRINIHGQINKTGIQPDSRTCGTISCVFFHRFFNGLMVYLGPLSFTK